MVKQVREPLPTSNRLSAYEKETVITFNELENTADVWSCSTSVVNKLKKRYELIEKTKFGSRFKVPKTEIKIGTATRVRRANNKKES